MLPPIFEVPPARAGGATRAVQPGSDRYAYGDAGGWVNVVDPTPQEAWDGQERRRGDDRRQAIRRQEEDDVLLDTRSGGDRRRRGRRATDHRPLGGFFFKA